MKKNGLLVLFLIFILMYILNSFTPLISDDYFCSFVWPDGVRINDSSQGFLKRVSGIEDVFESLRAYYFTWGGRIPGQGFLTFFLWQGKAIFNFVNAFMMSILVAEIYWLSHEGKITSDFNPSCLIWIFFALWTFNISFIDTCLWLSGSCTYLWILVLELAFLIPYVRSHFDENAIKNNSIVLTAGMFFLGFIAGWGHETTNCWIIVMLFYLSFESKKKGELWLWQIAGFAGFCLGYALLIFSPGNFSRLRIQQNSDSIIIASELLSAKLVELVIILLFHFIIWYFIVSFVFKYKRHKIKFSHKDTQSYLQIIKLFVLITCGSGLIMFFFPSRGFRPSFLNLVYLIIASAFLFRLQEVNGVFVINKQGEKFIKIIGYAYLIVTIFFSIWGNYINYSHLNNILTIVKESSKQSPKTVLKVPPSLTSQNSIWFFCSGFHVVPLPFYENENDEINRAFSRYYEIKGIKVVR